MKAMKKVTPVPKAALKRPASANPVATPAKKKAPSVRIVVEKTDSKTTTSKNLASARYHSTKCAFLKAGSSKDEAAATGRKAHTQVLEQWKALERKTGKAKRT